MKTPKSSENLIEEIFLSVDLTDGLGDLKLRQFIKILNKVSDEIIVESAIKIFENKHRNETLYLDQLYTGRILNSINPKSLLNLKSVLNKTLENWNKSVKDFPFWLVSNYKKEVINNELLSIINNNLESNERKDNARAMIWWINQLK